MRTTNSPRAVRSQPDPTAVFHKRDEMEDAVRALVKEGVSAQQIRISEATTVDGRVQNLQGQGGVVMTGLAIGAAVGALLALMWLLPLSGSSTSPLWSSVLRGAASGGIIGALVAVIHYGFARRRKIERGARTGDFVVTVKTRDERVAEDIRQFLSLKGGEPLPA